MARKPKGWKDNPLGEINKLYNAVMPGGRDVTQPQSLAQFKEVVRNTAAGTVKAADLYTTGGLGLSFAQNVIQPAATIASKETRTTKASKGMTQFAKDAAITAASAGAGVVAGKVVSKGAAKAVESGIPARIANKVTGQKVLVHGTPDFEQLIGNKLMPKAGSPGSPTEKVVFGYNPQFKGSGNADYLEGSVKQYTGPKGGAVIAKFPKKSLKKLKYEADNPGLVNNMAAKGNPVDPKNPPWVLSESPAKIVAKVPVNSGDFKNQLAKELKRAGAPLRDSNREEGIARMLKKVEQQKLLKRQRIADKNSPV